MATLTPKNKPMQRLSLENDLAKLVSELSNLTGKEIAIVEAAI